MLRCLLLLAWLTNAWSAVQDEAPETPDPDPVLTQARQAAIDTSETIEGFLCDKHIVRHHRDAAVASWHDRDTIDAEVAFDRGTGERYRNITVNGVPTAAKILNLKGSNSIGEFALDLRNLFGSIGNDSFHLLKVETRNGHQIRMYTYAVEQPASNWKVEENGHSVIPAFSGMLWIDAQAGRVIHMEMRACNLPAGFPEPLVTVVVDYAPVSIAGQKPSYLPTGGEAVFCSAEGPCDRNVIHFDHYRQFTAESTLTFTPPSVISPVAVPPPSSLSIASPWDPAALHFVGIAHPATKTALALELDDERFLAVDLQAPTSFPIREGDRVEVSTAHYDGHGLLAESIGKIGQASPIQRAQTKTEPPAAPADAQIRQARLTETELLINLPNYLCTENVKRYQNWPTSPSWQLLDRLSTDVLYRGQFGETYHNVRINGRASARRWEDIGGDVSTGEFGTMLKSLLAEETATFRFLKKTRVDGRPAVEYAFAVPRSRSDLHIRVDYQFIVPAYSGRIWFDEEFGRVLRLERRVDGIPSKFPLISVTDKVSFAEIHLRASQPDILPVRVETVLCLRKSKSCSRKIMQFMNYRLFTADSTLKF